MTADDPRPAGEACEAFAECTTTLPHHTHSDADGRSWCCQDVYPYPRPAASGGATDGEREKAPLVCGDCREGAHANCAVESPTFICPCDHPEPVMSQAGGELREEFRRLLFWGVDTGKADEAADALVALPAVQRLLADAAAVQRVRELHVPIPGHRDLCEMDGHCPTLAALDGQS